MEKVEQTEALLSIVMDKLSKMANATKIVKLNCPDVDIVDSIDDLANWTSLTMLSNTAVIKLLGRALQSVQASKTHMQTLNRCIHAYEAFDALPWYNKLFCNKAKFIDNYMLIDGKDRQSTAK